MEKIFKQEDVIISEYEDADMDHKINMYLQYRELRPDFLKIDQKLKFTSTNSQPSKDLSAQAIRDREEDKSKEETWNPFYPKSKKMI